MGRKIPYFDGIILTCLKKLAGERTIFSIYHLLKGKKSSQTIQDARLFQLTKLFGVYPNVSRESLVEVTGRAASNNWISPCEEYRFMLTSAGEEMLQDFQERYPALLYLNGWKYHQTGPQFWERLILLVQVISNLAYGCSRYIPVQKNKQVHAWIKSFFKKNKLPRDLLSSTIFSELVSILEQDQSLDPSVLVFRLTGYERIGLTSMQIAEKLNMEHIYYCFQFTNMLHYIIGYLGANLSRYPILSSLLPDEKPGKLLTNSSQITYRLWQKGYSIAEIAGIRGLKTNTIEDHIVEIAMNIESFSIDPYVDKPLQDKILAAAQAISSKQLKLIKSKVGSVNYFEIRLVLAKYGVGI